MFYNIFNVSTDWRAAAWHDPVHNVYCHNWLFHLVFEFSLNGAEKRSFYLWVTGPREWLLRDKWPAWKGGGCESCLICLICIVLVFLGLPYMASLEVWPYSRLGVGAQNSDHHLQLHLSLTVLDRRSDLEHCLLSQPKNAKIHKGKAKT